MTSPAKILAVVRGINTLATLVKELGVSAGKLNALVQKAVDEDRDLTVADLEPLKEDAHDSRDSLAVAIEEARRNERSSN